MIRGLPPPTLRCESVRWDEARPAPWSHQSAGSTNMACQSFHRQLQSIRPPLVSCAQMLQAVAVLQAPEQLLQVRQCCCLKLPEWYLPPIADHIYVARGERGVVYGIACLEMAAVAKGGSVLQRHHWQRTRRLHAKWRHAQL